MANRRGRPKGVTATTDMLAVVCLLKRLGWSDRKIGKIFRLDHETVRDWAKAGYKLFGDNFSAILVKDGRKAKIKPSGNATDLSYLYAKIFQNPSGGGRRIPPHKYDSNWEDQG